MARSRSGGSGCLTIVVVVVVLTVLLGNRSGPEDPQEDVAARFTMPDLVGQPLDEAQGALAADLEKVDAEEIGRIRSLDLSPRGRTQYQDFDWTVGSTRPQAGETFAAADDVYLFVLRHTEWQWFLANLGMPSVPPDVATSDLLTEGHLFHPVEELIEFRYAEGAEPLYPTMPWSRPDESEVDVVDDPSVEPETERLPRDTRPRATEVATLPVGTLPTAASLLRTGQLLTITVKDAPPPAPVSESVPGSGDVEVDVDVYVESDDDDEINVPGWLCPTRWC